MPRVGRSARWAFSLESGGSPGYDGSLRFGNWEMSVKRGNGDWQTYKAAHGILEEGDKKKLIERILEAA